MPALTIINNYKFHEFKGDNKNNKEQLKTTRKESCSKLCYVV